MQLAGSREFGNSVKDSSSDFSDNVFFTFLLSCLFYIQYRVKKRLWQAYACDWESCLLLSVPV